jgi:tetratricopeptide (TPR) repeat protein
MPQRGTVFLGVSLTVVLFAPLLVADDQQAESSRLNALFGKGVAELRTARWDAAIADFTEILNAQPKCAEAFAARGAAHLAKEQFDLAITDTTKAIELTPKATPSYLNRGLAYLAKNDLEHAMADFKTLLRIAPKSDEAFAGCGQVHFARKEYDQAVAAFTKAIEVIPEKRDSDLMNRLVRHYNCRGKVLLEKGESQKAEKDFEAALQILDKNGPANKVR